MSGATVKQTGSVTGVVVAAILAAFLPPYMASSLNVALPAIGREFSMTAIGLSWLVTGYLLAIGATILPWGTAGDRYGRRSVFLMGAIAYTITTVVAGCATSAPALMVMRVVQGIGAAMIFSTGAALLVAVVPPARRGAMLGFNVAFIYIGLSAGPALGGFLTQLFGWRSVFFTSAPLGLVLVAVILFFVKEERPASPSARFDAVGSALYGAALVAFMLGFPALPSVTGILVVGLAAITAAMFVVVERHVSAPLVDLGLFRRSAVFTFSGLAALLNYSATHGAGFLMSLYLQYVKGMPPRSAGLIMIFWPLLMALFSPLAGRLSDRVEARIVASAGMGLTAAALLYFSTIDATTHLYAIVAGLVALGTGVAFFSSPNASAIMGEVDRHQYGMAMSMVGTMRLIGQMLSMGIVAFIINARVGNSAVTAENLSAFVGCVRISFSVFGLLCVLGVAASLMRGRVREKNGRATGLPPGAAGVE